MEIKSYRIVWESDIDAADPVTAVKLALDSIANGDSKLFEVHEFISNGEYIPVGYVDLDDPEPISLDTSIPIKPKNF